MFSKIFRKQMEPFLFQNGFSIKTKGHGINVYQHEKPEYRLSFCNHAQENVGLTSYMDADLERMYPKFEIALGLLHFAVSARPFELPYTCWYYDNDEELTGALKKQCDIIRFNVMPIIAGQVGMDFQELFERNKSRVSCRLQDEYQGNWQEYLTRELLPKSEELKKLRF